MIDSSFLKGVELFADLSERDLDPLAGKMYRRRYSRGQVIFVKGEPATSLYVIEGGRVKILITSEQGEELIVHVLGVGASFGALGPLGGVPRWSDAVAQTNSVLLVLQSEDFLPFVMAHPQVATRVLSYLDAWLRRLAELAGDEAFLDVEARLAKVLLDLSDADARPGQDALIVSPNMTQTELAAMIGATRRSVNKWLRYYQREGLIRFEGGHITLLKPELLRRHASERSPKALW